MESENKRLTPRVHFSLILLLIGSYSVFVGYTIHSRGTTQKPINKLPSNSVLSIVDIIVGCMNVFIALLGMIVFTIRGRSFLVLFIILISIVTAVMLILSGYLFVTSTKFDFLDTMASDSMVTIEYEVCLFHNWMYYIHLTE